MAKETKVEAKGVTSFLNHDGYAFEANIYVNGKVAARVTDEGMGGPLNIYPKNEELFAKIEKGIEGMTWTSEFPGISNGQEYPMCMDVFLGELVEEAIVKKDARGKVLTEYEGKMYEWKVKFSEQSVQSHEAALKAAGFEGHKVLNHTLGVRVI